jgi:predicted  nucleic acid-binding Zn-ribbon protein
MGYNTFMKPGPAPTKIEEIKVIFLNKKVLLLGGVYNGKRAEHTFKCITCDNQFVDISNNVLKRKNNGCPKCCERNEKLTQEYINSELLIKNIKMIDEYKNKRTKNTFECLICGFKWSAHSYGVLKINKGCKKCFHERYTKQRQEKARERLEKYGDFSAYKRTVQSFTKTVVRKFGLFQEYEIGRKKYNIDHIRSIRDCFADGISPEIVSSPVNLQIMWWSDNNKKRAKSLINKEELLLRYSEMEKNGYKV